jgi:hypothetical protein
MSRKPRFVALLGALLLLSVSAALAGKGREQVALLPARTFNGAAENGEVLTDALRNRLEDAGLEVLPEREVRRVLRLLNRDLSRPLSVESLTEIRQELGVPYLVYPRVLSVGRGVNSAEPQATILVNVVGKPANVFIHTRQVGQVFQDSETGPLIINQSAADKAADKLLDGFQQRIKRRTSAAPPIGG